MIVMFGMFCEVIVMMNSGRVSFMSVLIVNIGVVSLRCGISSLGLNGVCFCVREMVMMVVVVMKVSGMV